MENFLTHWIWNMRIKNVTGISQKCLKYIKQFKYMAGGTNVYGIKFDLGTGKNVKTHTERSKGNFRYPDFWYYRNIL